MEEMRKAFQDLAKSAGLNRIESWSTKELMDAKEPCDRIIWMETQNGQYDAFAELIVKDMVETAKTCGISKTVLAKLLEEVKNKYEVTITE